MWARFFKSFQFPYFWTFKICIWHILETRVTTKRNYAMLFGDNSKWTNALMWIIPNTSITHDPSLVITSWSSAQRPFKTSINSPWTKWPPLRYFRCIFRNEKFCILIKISLKFVPKGPTDNNPALVLIMACRPDSLMYICGTWGMWINLFTFSFTGNPKREYPKCHEISRNIAGHLITSYRQNPRVQLTIFQHRFR